jgi:hypothetical protein
LSRLRMGVKIDKPAGEFVIVPVSLKVFRGSDNN